MKQVNWKKLLLPNLPYVFIALFCTKLGQAARLAPGEDFAGKFLHFMEGLSTAFAVPLSSFHPADLCVGFAIAAAIRLGVYVKGKNAKKFRKNMEYGSARWGTAEDIKPYVNNALEAAGRPERIDHRSYKRQGVEKVPTIHMGVAAARMERRGIQTDKGNVNRQIAADNKLLKEIKARITRLYNWSKEQAAQPQSDQPTIAQLWQMQQEMNQPTSRSGKVKNLQAQAALFNLLSENGITTMPQLHDKIAAMNSDYYDLRGKIVTSERRIAKLEEQLTMWQQYERYKAVRRQYANLKPSKRTAFEENHHAELALFETAARYLENLKSSGEAITPKKWQAEINALTAQKDSQYRNMRAMREEIKSVERLRKAAEQISKAEPPKEHEPEH